MKILILFILLLHSNSFGQESSKKEFLELGITGYNANISFGGFDIDIIVPFYQNNNDKLSFKTSLMTFVPASIFQSDAPYILFGALWELQYSLSLKNGFYFAMETGLGVVGEFFQDNIYEEGKGFYKDYKGTPYGMYSAGMRMGYDFAPKYQAPIKFAGFVGYRMQFPYNLTIKHFILVGASLSYSFNWGG